MDRKHSIRSYFLLLWFLAGVVWCLDLRAADNGASSGDTRTFAGLKFGVALSVTRDFDDNRVNEATIETEVEDGEVIPRVRVTKENNTRARIMIESHYFFNPLRPIPECAEDGRRSGACLEAQAQAKERYEPSERRNWGWGPFVAIQPGTDEIIEAIGAGLMVGWKRPGSDYQSFNVGIGLVVDPNVRILGDGFTENASAPIDENGDPIAVRFKETDQAGALVVFSFNF